MKTIVITIAAMYVTSVVYGAVSGESIAATVTSNKSMTYGETGLPRNCRAIIQANVDEHRAGKYTAEDALMSIERNCGNSGYAWGK